MSEITRRMIPGKLLVHTPSRKGEDGLFIVQSKTKEHDVKVFLSGRALEGEHQIEDGQLLKIRKGGSTETVDGEEYTLIDYNQILYIY